MKNDLYRLSCIDPGSKLQAEARSNQLKTHITPQLAQRWLLLASAWSFSIPALLACALLLGCTSPTAAAPENKTNNRYNVLFIAVDDLRPELGCYGKDYVSTPNIDKLAAGGMTFLQHFVAVPTCGASRHALLTGRSPLNSGVRGGNNSLYKLSQEQLPGAQSMPELFNRSGYHTTLIGKISHTADGKVTAYNGKGDGRPELPGAWDDFATPYGPWKRGWGVFFAYADGKHREDGGGHRDLMEFVVEKDTDLPDGLMAEAAVEKLKELKDKEEPFFMGLGFYKPHLPFVAPKQDWDAVQLWDVPKPEYHEGMDSIYRAKSGEFYGYKTTWKKTRPLALDDAMAAKRGYLACVRYTDRQVGKVLDALEEQGLADNTIVVLWGDHGWFLGEGAQWGKHTPLETALHSPLIIRAPGAFKKARQADKVASTIDIYPTLIDLCKPTFTKTAWPLDGISLGEIPRDQQKEIAISTWGNAISLRSMSHRLVVQLKDGKPSNAELYDLRVENGAYVDVADQQPEVVKAMLKKLPQ